MTPVLPRRRPGAVVAGLTVAMRPFGASLRPVPRGGLWIPDGGGGPWADVGGFSVAGRPGRARTGAPGRIRNRWERARPAETL